MRKFSFGFLGLDDVGFYMYITNELIRWLVFQKPFKTLQVRALSERLKLSVLYLIQKLINNS
jgi:hypothetical protein